MALDRESIEKRDSFASSASEQVRAIIEAAEATAAEILRQSEKDAREIRAEAARESLAARAELLSLIDGFRDSLGPPALFENEPSPSVAGPLTGDGAAAPHAEAAAETGPESEVAADIDGARLVALNMALNGTPRDETDRYLSENFQLDDRMTLLDEIYSSVQG